MRHLFEIQNIWTRHFLIFHFSSIYRNLFLSILFFCRDIAMLTFHACINLFLIHEKKKKSIHKTHSAVSRVRIMKCSLLSYFAYSLSLFLFLFESYSFLPYLTLQIGSGTNNESCEGIAIDWQTSRIPISVARRPVQEENFHTRRYTS